MVPTEGVETSKQTSLIFAWMRKNIINKRYYACFASLGIIAPKRRFPHPSAMFLSPIVPKKLFGFIFHLFIEDKNCCLVQLHTFWFPKL
jgi:hypothetical protein